MFLTTLFLAAGTVAGSFTSADLGKTPFPMERVPEYVFPARDFKVSDYGAVADGKTKCHAAIQKAIDACAQAGGGRVVVPTGHYFLAPIKLRSNVELHLEDNTTLEFTDDPKDCLPPVMSSWEGLECMNYSPLVYAFGCTNVALTGKGTLVARMDGWRRYFRESATGIQDARRILYTWGATDVPVEKRDITQAAKAVMRPQLVQFNRSKNIRIEDIELKDSPFWTLHLLMSENVVIRRLRTNCYGFNNDGVDVEMTQNVLIEDCDIQAGDDGFVFKAGRNRDAWRVSRPTRNVVVRNSKIRDAVTLAAMGTELSGGIENIWVHDCSVDIADLGVFIKTNHRRGGFVRNITVENIQIGSVMRLFAMDANVLYQWAVFPDYEKRLTDISNITFRNFTCREAAMGLDFRGSPEKPIDNVHLDNIVIGRLEGDASRVRDVTNLRTDGFLVKGRGTVNNPWKERWPSLKPPTVRGSAKPAVASAWRGKHVVFLGDSISDKRHIGCTKNYWQYLAERLGLDAYVYAVNGAQLKGLMDQAKAVKRDLAYHVDAIIVFAGTNDYNGGVPQGEWFTVAEEETNRNGQTVKLPRRRLVTDMNTFRGRLNALMSYLKENFPTQQIILMTPIHRGFATFGERNVQPDESFPNARGIFFEEYIADIRRAADIWSVPLIDLYRTSGLTPLADEHYRFFHDAGTDRLHPNSYGQRRMALTMEGALLALPPEFKIHEGVGD